MMSKDKYSIDSGRMRGERIFSFCGRHRFLFVGMTLVLLVSGWAAFSRIHLTTDVAALLPDRGGRAVADFRRLAKAPLARRIVLRLRDDGGVGRRKLLVVADRVAVRLKAPFFSRVVSGPEGDPGQLFSFALDEWPNLMRGADYDQLRERLQPDKITSSLERVYEGLLQPTGFLQKKLLLADPLDFRDLIFPRLVSLNPLGRARVEEGHFISADGRETMLLIETPVAITDFNGARALVAELDRILKEEVPAGITPVILSGHLYTVANATAIQRDMVVVIGASLLALLLIFLFFIRDFKAFSVFLLPVLILGPALALTGLIDGSISAITIGFGAVLLGVAIDYGIHLYFALKSGTQAPAVTVVRLAPPLFGAALTTVGAFSVQLFSALPGQRQLALFAIFGIILALLAALLVLPHFLHFKPGKVEEVIPRGRRSRRPRLVLTLWALAMLILLLFAFKVNCVGDLRRINLVPDSLRAAETSLKSVWGEVRGRALVFAEGQTREAALQVNEKLYLILRRDFAPAEIVSLAPVLPSVSSQMQNRKEWQKFWSAERLAALRSNLSRAGKKIGFSATAFNPFVDSLKKLPPPLTEAFWRKIGFGALFDAMIEKKSTGVTILSLVPDGDKLAGLSRQCAALPGVHLVSPRLFNREVSAAISSDLQHFIGLSLIIVSLILLVLLRNLYQAVLALLPVLAGLISMFGIMGALGISFNIFNLVAAILIIGLGVDYGIFMVYRLFRGSDQATEKAVLVSGLTTLAGFGVLVLARHPALNSIGLTVLLGVGGALPTVLWVLPSLARLRDSE